MNDKRYTYDWFGHNGLSWIQWLARFKGKPNLRFLEIGCFEGRATVWLLEHIITHSTCRIVAIDTFKGSMEHDLRKLDLHSMYDNFRHNIKDYKERVITKKGVSQMVLRKLPLNYFDFIYVDGSHQAPDVLEDTLLSWRLLKRGGTLIWDDYSWGDDRFENKLLKPRPAIDAFLDIFKGRYAEIAKDRQVCIVKL